MQNPWGTKKSKRHGKSKHFIIKRKVLPRQR